MCKKGTLWQLVQCYGNASTKKGTFSRLPPFPGYYTDTGSESKFSFLLNLLQLEEAIRASPSSETQHFREEIRGLMEQIRAGISSHEYSKKNCSSSYTPCSVLPAFVGGSGLCNG